MYFEALVFSFSLFSFGKSGRKILVEKKNKKVNEDRRERETEHEKEKTFFKKMKLKRNQEQREIERGKLRKRKRYCGRLKGIRSQKK